MSTIIDVWLRHMQSKTSLKSVIVLEVDRTIVDIEVSTN